VELEPSIDITQSYTTESETFYGDPPDGDPPTARQPARRATDRVPRAAANPYAPPQADLTPPPSRTGSNTLHDPRTVSAGRGWGWIKDAWPLFASHPWAWMGALVTAMLINILLGLVPFAGSLIAILLAPLFNGGLAIGAHAQYGGGRFEIKYLFAGFARKPRELLLVGAASLGFYVAAFAVVGLILYALSGSSAWFDFFAVGAENIDPDQLARIMPQILLGILLVMALTIPAYMMVLFAPTLVALNDTPVLRAFSLSFRGCVRNLLPFLIFGLVVMGLGFASLFTLGLAWLVLVPLLMISFYIAYRDIYYR
jgi:hypothetical protein